MRKTSSTIAIALLFALATFQVSCTNKVTMHFSETESVDIDAAFNSATKEVVITLDTTKTGRNTAFEASPFLNNATWFPETSEWMNMTTKEKNSQVYALNFTKVLNESENTNSDSPCAFIALTKDVLCNFRIVQSSVPYPIWIKVEGRDSDEPTIKILGGAFNNSLGHFYAKDGTYTNKSLENEAFYIQAESEAKYNQPERKLVLRYKDSTSQAILKAVRPALIQFTCPNFKRLSLFELDTALQLETSINLAKLGLPFEANYSCDSTLIFTEFNNNASLVPLKASVKVPVRANPNYTEWELPFPEVVNFRYNFAKMEEVIESLKAGLAQAKSEAKTDLINFMLTVKARSDETKANVTENFENIKTALLTMKTNVTEKFLNVATALQAMKANVTENFENVKTAMQTMKTTVTENFMNVATGMQTMKTNVTENFGNVKVGMETMKKNVTENFQNVKTAIIDVRTLVIILFVLVGLLAVAVLIQCFLIRRSNKSGGGHYSNDVEINSSPYVKA